MTFLLITLVILVLAVYLWWAWPYLHAPRLTDAEVLAEAQRRADEVADTYK
jgi:hypothetical protein